MAADSADPRDLARFWAGLLGGTPAEWYPGWVTLEPPPHGQRLSFQGVAGIPGRPPAGSDAGGPIVHFDVLVNDLAGAHKRIVASGGAFLSGHVSPRPGPGGEAIPWRVYRKILPARLVTGPAAKPAASGSSPPAAQAGIHRRSAGAELD
jgi:hypothetical protein